MDAVSTTNLESIACCLTHHIIKSSKVINQAGNIGCIKIHIELNEAVDVIEGSKLMINKGRSLEPLTRIEWARLSVICSYGPVAQNDEGYTLAIKVTPSMILPPPCTLVSVSNLLQMCISYKAFISTSGTSNNFAKGMALTSDRIMQDLTHNHKKDYNKLISRAKKARTDSENCLYQWMNKTLFTHFLDFFHTLSEEEKSQILKLFKSLKNMQLTDIDMTDNLKLENNGYDRQVSHAQ